MTRKRISRIAPIQLGKVAAVLYGIFSIPIVAIMTIPTLFDRHPDNALPLGLLALLPVIYIVLGFIFMALGALVYNIVAKWVGGIEFTTEEVSDA